MKLPPMTCEQKGEMLVNALMHFNLERRDEIVRDVGDTPDFFTGTADEIADLKLVFTDLRTADADGWSPRQAIRDYMRHSGCTLEQAQHRVGKAELAGKTITRDGITFKFR